QGFARSRRPGDRRHRGRSSLQAGLRDRQGAADELAETQPAHRLTGAPPATTRARATAKQPADARLKRRGHGCSNERHEQQLPAADGEGRDRGAPRRWQEGRGEGRDRGREGEGDAGTGQFPEGALALVALATHGTTTGALYVYGFVRGGALKRFRQEGVDGAD